MGLTKGTWSTYRTAESMFKKCCEEKGIERILPASEELILIFIHWMAFHRGGSGDKAAACGAWVGADGDPDGKGERSFKGTKKQRQHL